MVRLLLICMLASLSLPFSARGAEVEFAPFPSAEFTPARGDRFRIPVKVTVEAEVTVKLYTSDGDLVATIGKPGMLKPGAHEFLWAGKDTQGMIVANEAYLPVLSAKLRDGRRIEVDPRTNSGGEVVDNLRVEITPNQEITYVLPALSRVLIRVGIKNGPMMRSLANWVPRTAGKNIQNWNGFDADNLVDLRNHERLSVLVSAYKLPDHAIITTGNEKESYAAYREGKGWPEVKRKPAEVLLERDGKRIARDYYMPRTKIRDPKVTMTMVGDQPKTPGGAPILEGSTTIRVDIPEDDRALIQESLYEVAFFVDNEFVSEEEQGYMPLTWVYKPVGLAPGNHTLTVNVSGLNGLMGVRNLAFSIPGRPR